MIASWVRALLTCGGMSDPKDDADEEESLSGVPAPGDVIASKYEVEKIIGAGAMGVVLSAMHKQLQQRVAIKVLRPWTAAQPVVVQRFMREARAGLGIQSEHVARIMDVGTLDT